jgi:hypothetical protein
MRFRFRIGTSDSSDPDRVGAAYGWFIDDIQIYTCTATPSPTPTPGPVSVPTGQLIYLPVLQRNWTTAGPPNFP